jgi:murein DD-endopeptidase MepM/ murein hydrolase activator NlpD
MRPWLVLPVVVLFALVPSTAAAQSVHGGALDASEAGGAEYGASAGKGGKRSRTRRPLLRATHFAVTPGTVVPGGRPAEFAYRVDGPARRVRVRIELLAPGARSATARIRLGWKPTGIRRVHRWPVTTGALDPGRYAVRLHAVDDKGRTLARSASAPGRTSLRVKAPPAAPSTGSGLFPVRGAWNYGGEGARFGAERGTHIHQGQDIMAAEGTPVITPRSGYVYWKAYQEGGAGHYLVIRGDDGRDLVFMHLRTGSLRVEKGATVSAGQRIAEVGNTGRSSAPHLHFEIWPCGWYAKGCKPIDPRPDLDAWAASGRG